MLSSGISDLLEEGLSWVNELNWVPRLKEVVALPDLLKWPQARKNWGTDGRQAALRTKSFSILFHIPIRIP
jgi:hypothetical protein